MRQSGFVALCAVGMLFLVPSPASTQECVPAPEGLVGWWSGDGDATDIAGSHSGILEGGAGFDTGMVADAFSLDGIDDFVRLPALVFGPAFTVDAWIYQDVSGAFDAIFGLCDDPNSTCTGLDYKSAIIRVNTDGALSAAFAPTSFSIRRLWAVTGGGIVTPGVWHHIAFTVNSATNEIKIYLDGTQRSATLDNAGSGAGSFTGVPFIGARNIVFNQTVDRHFPGRIDEVEYFDRALSGAEIASIYHAGPAGKCKDDDGDGFRPPADCDESDSNVNPDAAELPGNLVDENCDGDLGQCSPCTAWRNHGEYVRCVSHAVDELVGAGQISEEVGDALVGSAARSDVGKPGAAVPEECE